MCVFVSVCVFAGEKTKWMWDRYQKRIDILLPGFSPLSTYSFDS